MPLDWTAVEHKGAPAGALKEYRPRRPMAIDWVPAQAGDALQDVDTPALVLELDKFDANLKKMMSAAKAAGVRVRPHAKTHKCAEIARRQVEAGAVGVCCQKLGEAEAMLAGGIEDVLITNEVVGEVKMRRLARLARSFAPARLALCVDDIEVARQLGSILRSEQARLDVYVELDVGQGRCGVADAADAVALARFVAASPAMRFMGLHAYHGLAQHRRGVPERREAAAYAAARAALARDALAEANIPCEVITGGGTGTFAYEAASGVYNEVQPGSFIFMDLDYFRNQPDGNVPAFEQSLFVLGAVMSLRGDRVTLDAGLKAFSTDCGPARPSFPGWQVWSVSDEHTVLMRVGDAPALRLGDKTLLAPGHCDPTVNLHDWIVATRRGHVEALWPVNARGKTY